jgi:dTMP kinase
MSEARLRLRSGSLVVFEGLDRSGKSTQLSALTQLPWAEPAPVFTHMPSGLTNLTKGVYRLTEDTTINSPLARQLLHLACHAENIHAVGQARDSGGVVLDRWWWSTVAYGWHGARLADGDVDESTFFGMIDAIWSRLPASVVFLFTTPYRDDTLNRDQVRDGYARLAAQYPAITVVVPEADPDSTTHFVLATLRERNLVIDDLPAAPC